MYMSILFTTEHSTKWEKKKRIRVLKRYCSDNNNKINQLPAIPYTLYKCNVHAYNERTALVHLQDRDEYQHRRNTLHTTISLLVWLSVVKRHLRYACMRVYISLSVHSCVIVWVSFFCLSIV